MAVAIQPTTKPETPQLSDDITLADLLDLIVRS